jgi:hypothetical protein
MIRRFTGRTKGRQSMENKVVRIEGYDGTCAEISGLLENARQNVVRIANSAMVMTCWEIGRRIVELEQRAQSELTMEMGLCRVWSPI